MSEKEFVDGEMICVLLDAMTEIEGEIRNNGHCQKEKARLYHELGSIHCLMGDKSQQEAAWLKAVELDPQSETFRQSLVSLRGLKVST